MKLVRVLNAPGSAKLLQPVLRVTRPQGDFRAAEHEVVARVGGGDLDTGWYSTSLYVFSDAACRRVWELLESGPPPEAEESWEPRPYPGGCVLHPNVHMLGHTGWPDFRIRPLLEAGEAFPIGLPSASDE